MTEELIGQFVKPNPAKQSAKDQFGANGVHLGIGNTRQEILYG